MMNYRGPEMAEFMESLLAKLRSYLDTKLDVFLMTTSGTGALEAAVVNTLSPGDRVLGVNAGVFGKRFCSVASAYGASMRTLEIEWGRALDPDVLRAALREESECRGVLLTHNETSTGVVHPIEELSKIVREESDATLFVDAVSSLGATPLAMDTLGLDVVITGSQKAWGVPPGMGMLFVSERAWKAHERATMPRFFFELDKYRNAQVRGSFPFTPALPILFALDVSLDFMLRETAEGVFSRHRDVAAHARSRVASQELELFADDAHASPTVTAIRVPEGVDEEALIRSLRDDHDTVFARGQEILRGDIIRLGHLGWVQQPEIDAAMDALATALVQMGHAAE